MKVEKRDGKTVDFDQEKIRNAVYKAGGTMTDADAAIMLVQYNQIRDFSSMKIARIQELVEESLMKTNPAVARAYIEYRHDRDIAREQKSKLFKDISGMVNLSNKEITNENANKDARVFPTQRDLLAGIVAKHFARNHILPKHIVEAHDSGDIHYHDLDYSPFTPYTNCCLVDLKGMLENGFKMGNADIEPPKSIGVATALMAQITAQIASHQYGGTTFANVDQVLAPYVEMTYNKHFKDAVWYGVPKSKQYAMEKTEKDVFDAFQSYEYEVNTLHTANGQTPFVTITFGMGTGWRERMIQKAILKNRIRGLGKKGITPVFPKLVMFMEKGINLNPEDRNYDIKKLALECASKRMYPDIISAANNRRITGSSIPVSPMGCRSFLSVWNDEHGNEILDGRNNLGVVTINLPRIAIEAEAQEDEDAHDAFWRILDERLELCFEALMTRIDSLRGVKASVAPILYTEGAFGVRLKPDDEILELFKNGRSSISLGYIGLHETLMLFGSGQHPFDRIGSQNMGRLILEYLRAATEAWKKKTGFGFSLYSTPAESLCHRFCKLDYEKFGSIKGITDKGWYTNSFHLDVDRKVTPFEKIDYEADYHYIATAGHISYVEFPDMKNNLEALEKVWDYAMDKLDYFGTNLPVDKCFECGSDDEFKPTEDGFHCTHCGNHDPEKMSVTRRTCGYLGAPAVRGFNEGKNKEMMHRTKHQN
ncbi:anaerobic ribonucleoside-triphosphate reductase [Klebsiella phage phiKp_4]|nr:anaerobic ribonucleoside-triphosphate reductase [Klebsiella phage phiKp_1]BEH83771.1 anaerobic ribonucleoside-triphosphate reductase [Klebsiella phage phiKp_3]BEH84166.1 anaerobic ribonucleoside-triphosphate reductase [Klebsiella phage phiKp_4]BEH84443.1 anaerobic ribonucleoside-triphosphate reductase [Klebsiella phage phiKp_5]BEH84836.1 anaerobic ribonucleoside-triphosphate reductase [Klebsiella phage phiKp_8]BEH84921.1 anaerobic ribonucleoside-triphosphate reductase [Klebsiella phage phiK